MIWGGINTVEPPYTVEIYSTKNLPLDVAQEIKLAKQHLAEARSEFNARKGHDVDVTFDIVN